MRSTDPIICVSGADGCGKSTLVAGMAESLPGCRVVTIWDLLGDPRAAPVFPSKAQLHAFLGALQPDSRAMFLMTCMKAAMERALGGVRIVDGYWYKYLAGELALGADPERVHPLGALFTAPVLTLHVSLAPEVAARRKAGAFSAYECGLRKPTAENFVEFQSRTAPIVRQLAELDCRQVVSLNGALPAPELLGQALRSVRTVVA